MTGFEVTPPTLAAAAGQFEQAATSVGERAAAVDQPVRSGVPAAGGGATSAALANFWDAHGPALTELAKHLDEIGKNLHIASGNYTTADQHGMAGIQKAYPATPDPGQPPVYGPPAHPPVYGPPAHPPVYGPPSRSR